MPADYKWLKVRVVALPPYGEMQLNFYRAKLAKINLMDLVHHKDIRIRLASIRERDHCREVLASHERLQAMERRQSSTLHDHQNTPSIPTSNQIP